MIFWIILTVIFFALFLLIALHVNENAADATVLPFCAFVIALAITIGCSQVARKNKMLYNDMAKNPQCYSINDLREAHRDIIAHKSRQGHWTSFYNGYEFPEINVNVMDEVDSTIHFVKQKKPNALIKGIDRRNCR